MKLLNNTKARISAATDTYPLYAVVTDDYSKMYNITSISADSIAEAFECLYDCIPTMQNRRTELPILIDYFSSYDDIVKHYPELLI